MQAAAAARVLLHPLSLVLMLACGVSLAGFGLGSAKASSSDKSPAKPAAVTPHR